MTKKMFNVGKIVNTHGIRGEVRVLRISDFEERFAVGEQLYLIQNNKEIMKLTVAGHRSHKNFDLLQFVGYDNVNDVEPFKGSMLKIDEEQLTDLTEGEYYYHEIIGCTVYVNNGEKLGVISEILSPGANDVWVIKRPHGKELLIPYIEDVVKQIDTVEKNVIIQPMEGLFD